MAMARDGGLEGWRYVYEALQNVRCLQILLFHPTIAPLQDCLNWNAVVRHGSSLRCFWDSPDGTPNSLMAPLPACLLDLSAPIRCWIRQDHVEVRLGLLSLDPALSTLQLSLENESFDFDACRQVDDRNPFSVNFDAQGLESNEGAHFFCRKCSCKLTNTPFRRVLEVPSMDWREISEHFYGNCCCATFGAQAEFLVARFQQLLIPSVETCLVASTTCIVHKENVVVSEGNKTAFPKPVASQLLQSGKNGNDPCVSESPKATSCADDPFANSGFERDSKNRSVSSESNCKLNHHQNGGEETTSVVFKEKSQAVGSACVNKVVTSSSGKVDKIEDVTCTDKKVQALPIYNNKSREEDPCCASSCSSRIPISTEFTALKEADGASPESLGNGFMTGPGSQSEVIDWEPFCCRSCSSLVGARRGDSSKKGIQFFKCQISTDESILSSRNIFRDHTLERLFIHELEKNTESNSSYRYVVRSFQTGAAVLQLVLLNQSALVSSGSCLLTSTLNNGDSPNDGKDQQALDRKPAKVSLETVAKFMFCDCRMLDLQKLRSIDKWAQHQKADDIFMLDAVADTLVDLLKIHQSAYPPSCQSFQQFSLSFLTK